MLSHPAKGSTISTAPEGRSAAGFAPSAPFDAARLRHDFPALQQEVNAHPLVYLDSGATAQKPYQVLDAERDFLEQQNSAVHRGAHTLAAAATERFEAARETVARFVGAGAGEIVWTSNATEAINLVAYGISNANANANANANLGRGGTAAEPFRVSPGDEIVVTELEHHSNLVPWQELAARTGAILRWIPIDDEGALRMEEAARIITPRTRVVAFSHVSNVLGGTAPVAELVGLARAVGAVTVLDACQSVPHRPVDLAALDVDFAAFSGHKMLGPTGIGVLYGRAELLNALPPFLTGGSMISTVAMARSSYLPAPQRFEAGTQKVSQAIGLAAAVDYLERTGMDRLAAWEASLGSRLVTGLTGIRGVRVLGPGAEVERAGLASFTMEGVHPHDVGQFLDDRGIAVRVGHHCTQPLHHRLEVPATTRASVHLYTTTDDVDAFLEAMADVRAFFGVG